MTENVLEELDIKEDAPAEVGDGEQVDENKRRDYWKKFDLLFDYDRGCMIAGAADGDGSVKEFLTKFILLLTLLAKNDNPSTKTNPVIFDLIKNSIDLYQESLKIKPDRIRDNAKFVAAVQGFVDQFVENRRYEDRL